MATTTSTVEKRSWPLLFIYSLAALAVAVGIVFGVRAIYNHSHHNSGKTVTQNTAGNKKSSTKPSTPSPTSSPVAAGSTSLPNNGPGNVAAIFFGSSLLAATGHFFITKRRRANASQ